MDNQIDQIESIANAIEDIQKFDRVRVLYELLLELLNLEKESNLKTMVNEIKRLAIQEQKAISYMAEIQRISQKTENGEVPAVS